VVIDAAKLAMSAARAELPGWVAPARVGVRWRNPWTLELKAVRNSHSGRWFATRAAVVCMLSCAGILGSAANAVEESLEPQVVASGTADVTIAATTAAFSIDIDSLAASAAEASAESTRLTKTVSSSLRTAGLSHGEVAESLLTVTPRWEYDQATQRQKRTGYQATTLIQIETDRLDRLGAYIDAALSAGATQISAISFSAKNSDEARRQALAQAVSQARADAETIARAGGGTLGQLLLLTMEPQGAPRRVEFNPVPLMAARSLAGEERPNIIPSRIKVSASVVGRWRFVPSGAAR